MTTRWDQLNNTPVAVNNTLTSVSATEALSAQQGNLLKALVDTRLGPDNYATATTGGALKARVSGTDLYLSFDGTNP